MFTSLRVLAYVVSLSLATHAVAQNAEGETEVPEEPTSSEAQTPTFSATPQPSDDPAPGDWAAWGRESGASRHSPLDEITPDNVSQLEVAWIYRTGDMPEEEGQGKYAPETTPLKVGDNLYLCSAMNVMVSLDARTGEEQWRDRKSVV